MQHCCSCGVCFRSVVAHTPAIEFKIYSSRLDLVPRTSDKRPPDGHMDIHGDTDWGCVQGWQHLDNRGDSEWVGHLYTRHWWIFWIILWVTMCVMFVRYHMLMWTTFGDFSRCLYTILKDWKRNPGFKDAAFLILTLPIAVGTIL